MPSGTLQNRYVDLDISLAKNPVTGDIYKLTDEAAVKRSVVLLVMTRLGERPFRSNLGSTVLDSLFDNADDFARISLQRTIQDTINNFEPRARLINVDVDFGNIDNNAITVTINMYLVNTQNPIVAVVKLERVR